MTMDQLGRLRARGLLKRRDSDYERHYPEVVARFVGMVERAAEKHRKGADTIVPNKKRRAKKARKR